MDDEKKKAPKPDRTIAASQNPPAGTPRLDALKTHPQTGSAKKPKSLHDAPTQFGGMPVPGVPELSADSNRTIPDFVNADGSVGRVLGKYELLEEIARGGMGVVYKARQLTPDRIVAIKTMISGGFAGEMEIRRFMIEAQSAGKLTHPNIVPIYEAGSHDGRHFISMAFVQGKSLAQLLRDGPMGTKQCAQIVRSVANAVQFAHENGIIHRDIKPGNILIDEHGEPKITDFGLAKLIDDAQDNHMTATGSILGTPGFMAPEQAVGNTKEVGPASDIYAIGAVLYAMMTSRAPFQCSSPVETLRQVVEDIPESPLKFNQSIDKDLETICLRCLEKVPAKRFGSARELADELDRYLRGEAIVSRRTGTFERIRRWCNRQPAMVAAFAAILVISAISVFVIRSIKESRDAKDKQLANLVAKMESTAKSDSEKEKDAPASAPKEEGGPPNDGRFPNERFREGKRAGERGPPDDRWPPDDRRPPEEEGPDRGPEGRRPRRDGGPDSRKGPDQDNRKGGNKGKPGKGKRLPQSPEELRERAEFLTSRIAADPHAPQPYYDRGRVYEALKEAKKAIDDYNKAIELDSSFDQAQARLAWVLLSDRTDEKLRDYSRALKLAETALENANPRTLLHFETLSEALLRNKQKAKAIKVLKDAFDEVPDFDRPRVRELIEDMEAEK